MAPAGRAGFCAALPFDDADARRLRRAGAFAWAAPAFDGGRLPPYLWRMTSIPFVRAGLVAAICACAILPAAAQVDIPLPGPDSGHRALDPEQPKSAPEQLQPEARAEEPKSAETVPEPEQRAQVLEELYSRLATAPDEETGAEIATAIEQLWQHSGSPTADLLMARAAAATESERRDLAMKLLNAAVELQPDYAEAWNRRAYLFYLDGNYNRALGDIRRVLALEPQHFKAIEGLANILHHLDEKKAALEAYESLLKVHPTAPGARKAADDLREQVEGRGI